MQILFANMTTGHYNCIVKRKIYKEDILNAGMELMFLNGYNATGIKEITQKVDIPKGSFYNHFNSKEEFGLAVVQQYCNNGFEIHKATLENKDLPPLERLRLLYDNFISQYQEIFTFRMGCIMGNFSLEMADVNEKFRALLEKEFDGLESLLAACIAEGQHLGEINSTTDSQTLAAFVLNSWHGAIVRMKSTASIKPLEDFRNLIFNHLLR